MSTPIMRFKAFEEEIESHGCSIVKTKKGRHYVIVDANCDYVSDFSLPHGKADEIKISYVQKFRRAIRGEL